MKHRNTVDLARKIRHGTLEAAYECARHALPRKPGCTFAPYKVRISRGGEGNVNMAVHDSGRRQLPSREWDLGLTDNEA